MGVRSSSFSQGDKQWGNNLNPFLLRYGIDFSGQLSENLQGNFITWMIDFLSLFFSVVCLSFCCVVG